MDDNWKELHSLADELGIELTLSILREANSRCRLSACSGADGTERLCKALYGKERVEYYIGGSEARMLHDSARVVSACRKLVDFWQDQGGGNGVMARALEDAMIDSLPNKKDRRGVAVD